MEVWIGEIDTKNITHISFGRGRYCKATLYAHVHIMLQNVVPRDTSCFRGMSIAAVLMNIESLEHRELAKQ